MLRIAAVALAIAEIDRERSSAFADGTVAHFDGKKDGLDI
jgi:hypothetical protein